MNNFSKTFFLCLIAHLFACNFSWAQSAKNELSEIEKLDERITDLEIKSLASKINLGFDLKVLSSYMSNSSMISGKNETKKNGHVGAVLMRLNTSGELSNKISAYASFESFSYFNDSFFNNSPNISNRENQDKGEKVFISKAYFDWKFYKDWFVFSAGRLPTTLGPPLHLKAGEGRKGTYPVTGYSVPLDGFAMTANLSKPMEMKHNLALRFIYNPGGITQSGYPYRGSPLGDYRNPARLAKNHQLFSSMVEFEQLESEHGIWGKMLAILQYGQYNFGSPQAYQTTGVTSASDTDNYRVYFDNDKLIKVNFLSPYFEFSKVLGLPVDLYATMSFSRSHSLSKVRAVKIAGPGSNPAGTDFELGSFIHSGRAAGSRLIIGSRVEASEGFLIGAEFMKSSRRALPTALYTDSLFSSNNLVGKTYELYFLKKLYNDNFIIRLGLMHADVNEDLNSLFYQKTKEQINTADLSFLIHI